MNKLISMDECAAQFNVDIEAAFEQAKKNYRDAGFDENAAIKKATELLRVAIEEMAFTLANSR